MAKNTVKQNALGMFNDIQPLKKDVIKEPEIKKEVKTEPVNREEIIETIPKEDVPAAVEEKSVFGISLKKKETVVRKGRCFYMDDNLYERLTKLAKKNGMSVSEALTEILNQVI